MTGHRYRPYWPHSNAAAAGVGERSGTVVVVGRTWQKFRRTTGRETKNKYKNQTKI